MPNMRILCINYTPYIFPLVFLERFRGSRCVCAIQYPESLTLHFRVCFAEPAHAAHVYRVRSCLAEKHVRGKAESDGFRTGLGPLRGGTGPRPPGFDGPRGARAQKTARVYSDLLTNFDGNGPRGGRAGPDLTYPPLPPAMEATCSTHPQGGFRNCELGAPTWRHH